MPKLDFIVLSAVHEDAWGKRIAPIAGFSVDSDADEVQAAHDETLEHFGNVFECGYDVHREPYWLCEKVVVGASLHTYTVRLHDGWISDHEAIVPLS